MTPYTLAYEATRSAPSADNSQHWCFSEHGGEIGVLYRQDAAIDPFGPCGHGTALGIGATAENLQQITQTSGESKISWGKPSSGEPYYFFSPPPSRTGSRDHPLFKRHTNRFRFDCAPPDRSLLQSLAQLGEGNARLSTILDESAFAKMGEITRTCCQARFCNEELHNWLMGSLRFTPDEIERGDGLDINTLDLPPGGQQFMRFIRDWRRMKVLNALHAFKPMAAIEVAKLLNASMLICIVGKGDLYSTLSAGQLMQRAWIELNRLGWGVHPFYVVADQQTRHLEGRVPPRWSDPVRHALDALPDVLSLNSDERLHIVLRVGKPKVKPPRSRRLPIARLMAPLKTED